MASNQRIMEAVIRIGGEMDKSVQMAMKKSSKSLATLNKKFASFEKAAVKSAVAVTAAFTGVAVALGTKAVKAAAEFEKSMANVGTLLDGTTAQVNGRLNEMGDEIIAVAKRTGVAYSDLSQGAYDYVSALGDSEDAIKGVEAAAKAGAAGLSTTSDALRLSTALTKAYGDTSLKSQEKAYDLAFTTVKLGQTTFSEMANALPKVTALSESMNVQQEELFGYYATLTGVLGNADIVSTQFKAILTQLSKPTDVLQDKLKQLGYSSYQAMIDEKGLQASLLALRKTMKDENEMAAAFGSVEAYSFFLAATGAQADSVRDKTKAMYEATGAADEAYKKQMDTLDGVMKKMKNYGSTAMLEIGRKLLPVVKELAEKALPHVEKIFEELVAKTSGWIDAAAAWFATLDFDAIKAKMAEVVEKVKNVFVWVMKNKDAILEVGKKLLIAYGIFRGFAIVAGIISSITTVFGALKTAVLAVKGAVLVCKGAWAALKAAQIGAKIASVASTVATWAQVAATWALNAAVAVLTSPIFLVVAAIAAAIAIGWLLYNNWDTICEYLKTAWEGVKNFFFTAVEWLGGVFSGFWEGIKSGFSTVFEALPAILKSPINAIISLVNGAIEAINGIGFTIPDWIPGIGGKAFKLNIPKLPMLATGGFTNGASIAGEAGTEAVISFDPAYRRQNQGYLMTAAEMLGMTAAPKASHSTYNLGGITFSPVLQTGDKTDSGNILKQLRACLPDLVDMIEDALREKEAHRYV